MSRSMESCHALILRSASLRASHASDSSGVLNILGQPFSGGFAGTRDERLIMYVGLPIDVEVLKRIADDKLEAAGVRVLFHTVTPDVVKNAHGDRLDAVVLANKDGLTLARGRVFIDATGDADLCARAGCPFEIGDADGHTQGMTSPMVRHGAYKLCTTTQHHLAQITEPCQ